MFFTVQQFFGTEKTAQTLAQQVKAGMTLEVRGDYVEKSFQGKDGTSKSENIITAKGIAASLTQPGLSVSYEKPKAKSKGQER